LKILRGYSDVWGKKSIFFTFYFYFFFIFLEYVRKRIFSINRKLWRFVVKAACGQKLTWHPVPLLFLKLREALLYMLLEDWGSIITSLTVFKPVLFDINSIYSELSNTLLVFWSYFINHGKFIKHMNKKGSRENRVRSNNENVVFMTIDIQQTVIQNIQVHQPRNWEKLVMMRFRSVMSIIIVL